MRALAVVAASAALAAALAGCIGDEVLRPIEGDATASTGATSTGAGGAGNGGGDGSGASPSDVIWAKRWGGAKTDERVIALLAEPDDAVVLAGSIGVFGRVEPSLRAVDEEDVLLARFDADGAVSTARTVGGFGQDAPRALARREDGSLVLLGVFGTALDEFDPRLVAFGAPAPFVAAFDVDLTARWGVALLGAATGRGQLAMALDSDGGVIVVGTFDRVLALRDALLVAEPGSAADGFVARLAPDGRLDWLVQLEGSRAEHLELGAVAVVGGAVVVAAQLQGVFTIHGAPVAASPLDRRPVLLRLDANGEVLDASVIAGGGAAAVTRMASWPGGLVAALSLGGTVVTAEGEIAGAGEGDATLLWADLGGAALSARTWGDRRSQGISALVVGSDGGVAITGTFQSALDFGDGVLKASSGRPDGFVAELDPEGRALRAFAVGDAPLREGERPGSQSTAAVARLSDGDLVIGGGYTGAIAIGDVVFESRGGVDSWIARIAAR